MSTAITDGYYAIKLTDKNFIDGLYVISYDKKIYVTSIFISIRTITHIATGQVFHYSNGWDEDPYGYRLFIIEDDSLIKIQVKVNN
jgi:hypothetical protein